MTRGSVWLLNAIIAGSVCAAEEPLPEKPEDALEIEPPVLIQSRLADGTLVVQGAGLLADSEVEIVKLEKELTRAQRNADGGERLYKSGIISKVDSENRALRVIQLGAQLAEARLAVAKRKAGEQEEMGRDSGSGRTTSDMNVAQAAAAAQRAAEERRRAELDAAFRNLRRQQKLLALGSGRKADVNRAEQKLAELQRVGD